MQPENYVPSKWRDGHQDRAGQERRIAQATSVGDGRPAKVLIPNGNTNSSRNSSMGLSDYMALGNVCPVGYEAGSREYFPRLRDRADILWLVGRPQHAPTLAAEGIVDAFISFGDVVAEAEAAGVRGIEQLLELRFAEVSVVVVARGDAPLAGVPDLLSSPAPITCLSELPFLTREAFGKEPAYTARFGRRAPCIEKHGRKIVAGHKRVRIIESPGSSEALVSTGSYDCGVVVRSTGKTIQDCRLCVVKVIGRFRPGLFCRAGLRDDPAVAPQLEWLIGRLQAAQKKWERTYGDRRIRQLGLLSSGA